MDRPERKVLWLPAAEIRPNPMQPRRTFEEAPLRELAESIRLHGIIQPLTVRKLASGYYQIIAGERRWRAARMAGLDEVPVLIKEVTDEQAAALALIENLQREDLDPIEVAEGCKKLIERYGLTQEEAAKRLGKSRSAITNAMRLLDAAGIAYRTAEYEYDESDLSGKHAAQQVGLPEEQVFKTLVTRGDKTGLLVFCIPVSDELDLRRAASVSGNKKLEMIHVKELLPLTGYIRGGCSPIGMKKKYPTYIDETSILFDEIAVSAGQRGLQIILSPDDLARFVDARVY